MSWHGMGSGINIRVIISVLMGLVIFHSMCYLYINNYLRMVFAAEKQLTSSISKPIMDGYTDDWIKKMEEKHRQENERIRNVCKEYRTQPFFDSKNNDEIQKNIVMSMVIDVKHRLNWCSTAKVTSYFYLYCIGINMHAIFEIDETIL